MASVVAPASGDRGICGAVALGWQVTQLFHAPVGSDAVADPPRGDRLPGRSHFSNASKSLWLAEQIQSEVAVLLPAQPEALTKAMGHARTALADAGRTRDATLDAVFTLHCRLLETLTIADYRLGKSYGLGRAMAETALLPANAAAGDGSAQVFLGMLDEGRLITIKDWLADLKTLLPDHTAYAVSRSLDDWAQWARTGKTGGWDAARLAMGVQGRIWRQLLTGEKAARDILTLADYHAAALRVARRVITRFWWYIAGAVLLAAAFIFLGTHLDGVPLSLRLLGDIAWLVGALGVTLRGASAALGIGFKDVEGWLWKIELDGSIAIAATCLPAGAKASPVSGGSLGELRPEPAR